jgi:hypothetical protein
MAKKDTEIIVGVLGQWASGKSTAADTLVKYLGGEAEVNFITDRELLAGQAVNHILELEESKVQLSIDKDGNQRFDGELATVFLHPGEDLKTVELNTLLFDLDEDIYDNVGRDSYNWIDEVRLELGRQVLEKSAYGKPIVIEAGFGTNLEPRGENPFSHTILDLLKRLEEAGVEPSRIKWIIIEAEYERRSLRNQQRPDTVPAREFDRFATDGGDLDPEDQERFEAEGIVIRRVQNNHNDVGRFKADIITTYKDMFRTV